MPDNKTCASFVYAAVLGVLLPISAARAQAQAPGIGLVVGNSAYASLPALPACQESSRTVASALRSFGYEVVERQDTTGGALAAAVNELARRMAAAPEAGVITYICGYAAGLGDRPFLLPVSATVQRPTDLMTQGTLAKTMVDVIGRGRPNGGLLILDLAPAPGLEAPDLAALASVSVPDGVGMIAVTAPPAPAGPTALSTAVAEGLVDPSVDTAGLLGTVDSKLRGAPAAKVAVLRIPRVPHRLLAAEEPTPPPTQTASSSGRQDATPPPPEAPSVGFPSEEAMTEADRQRIQESLARLGYYGARIDGLFGPETRAAIRRYQHEIGAAMTGKITSDQASRLLASP